jgi:hypothetical protein
MVIRTAQDLTYRVVITREAGEHWPPVEAGKFRYDVTEVVIEVGLDDGELKVRGGADVRAGRLIRKDGTLGREIGGGWGYCGPRGSEVAEQAAAFTAAALKAARGMHATMLAGGPPVTDAQLDAAYGPGYAADLAMLRKVGMDRPDDYWLPGETS